MHPLPISKTDNPFDSGPVLTAPPAACRKHIAAFGKSGVGKSTLLRNMIAWDIEHRPQAIAEVVCCLFGMTLRVSPVNEPIPSSRLPATTDRSPSRVEAWLVCLAYFFPIYFVSQVVLFVFPALIRVPLLGYRLRYLELGFSYAIAISTPPAISGDLRPGTQPPGYSALGQTVLLVAGCAALLIVLGRRHRALTGLALAILGQAALMRFLPRAFFARQIDAALGLASLLFFVVLALGLGSMPGTEMTRRYWLRVAALLAVFSSPLATVWGLEALVRGAGFPSFRLPPPRCHRARRQCG